MAHHHHDQHGLHTNGSRRLPDRPTQSLHQEDNRGDDWSQQALQQRNHPSAHNEVYHPTGAQQYSNSKYTSPQHLKAYEGHGYGDDDYDEYEHDDQNLMTRNERTLPPQPPQHSQSYARYINTDPLHVESPGHEQAPQNFFQYAAPMQSNHHAHTRQVQYARTRGAQTSQVASTYIPTGAFPGSFDFKADTYDEIPYQDPVEEAGSHTSRNIPSESADSTDPLPLNHSSPSPSIGSTRHPLSRPLPGTPAIDTSVALPLRSVKRKSLSRQEEQQQRQDALFEEVENAVLNAGTPASYASRSAASVSRIDSRFEDQMPGADLDEEPDYEADAGLAAMRAAEEEEREARLRYHARKQSQASVPQRRSVGSRAHSRKQSLRSQDEASLPPSPSRHFSNDQADEHELFYPPAFVDDGAHGGLVEPDGSKRRPSFDEGDDDDFHDSSAWHQRTHSDFEQDATLSKGRPLPPPPPISSRSSASSLQQDTPPYPADANTIMPPLPSLQTAFPRSASMLQSVASPVVSQPARAKTDAIDRVKRQSGRLSAYSSVNSSRDSTPLVSPVSIDLPSLPSKRFNPAKLTGIEFKKCKEPWSLSAICQWLVVVTNPDEYVELRESEVRTALIALFTYKVPTLNIADAESLGERVIESMYSAGTLQKVEEWIKLSTGDVGGVLFQLTGAGCYSPSVHDNEMSGRCYSHHCQRSIRKADLHLRSSAKASTDWATFYKMKKEDLEGRTAKEIERQNILHEIVNTEHDFIEQLDVLRELYRDSLAHASPVIIAPPRRLHTFLRDIFGKVDAIKQANQDNLLAQLKYRQSEQGPWIRGFSDLFRQWIRKARTVFIDYAADFPKSVLLIRHEIERNLTFRKFLDDARANKRSGKLGWDTFLKAPITRLQRYSLLLNTVNKSMKEESEEKTELELAISEIKAVTMECDGRVAENQRKVDLEDWSKKLILRPEMQRDVALNLTHLGRELVHSGELQRHGGTRFNWLDCTALLFDHYFVLAKAIQWQEKGTGTKVEKFDVSRLPIPMDLLVLDSYNDPPVMKSTYVKGLTSVSAMPSRPSAMDLTRLGRSQTNSPAPGSASPGVDSLKASHQRGQSLQHTSSAPTMITTTTITEAAKDSDKIIYPFKIKHLGRRDPYILFAPTAKSRAEWANKIIEAKTKHAKSLYAQNAEPFGLRVIADSAFGYEYSSEERVTTVTIKGTPIDRAIREVEAVFNSSQGVPPPVCRAKINCATKFTSPESGKEMIIVGSDFGLFLCANDNPRGWIKALSLAKVTQVAALEEFNLLLVISNGALIAHHLDVLNRPGSTRSLKRNSVSSGRPGSNDSTTSSSDIQTAPQKLSGSKDVNFFAAGRMKDNRMLIVYKKRDGMSSAFKILEPINARATERKRGGGGGSGSGGSASRIAARDSIPRTESFREYDEFTVASECSGINLFRNSLAIGTMSRGFEVHGVEKLKTSFSVPDLRTAEVANIASHIDGQQTLGMLRLSEQEFLVCYEQCAVYINRYGDVSRSAIMSFVGKARAASLARCNSIGGQEQQYLVLFDQDFVEVRNAQNGRLNQIIAGREVKCLDTGNFDGSRNTDRTIKFAMQHPENEKVQILLEMIPDSGQRA